MLKQSPIGNTSSTPGSTDLGTTLVTGATGKVGSGLVAALTQRGLAVKAATRAPDTYAATSLATPVRFEVTDPSTFDEALAGVTQLFLLTPPGYADAYATWAPFLERALSRVKKVVTMTADGVQYSDEIPMRRVELAVAKSGLSYAHLRPGWFADNFHTFWLPPILSEGVIPLPVGDSKTTFIDSGDTALAAAATLTTDAFDGQAFSLTGPESLSYGEAAEILSQATGRSIRHRQVDDDTFRAYLRSLGVPPDYTELLVSLFVPVRAGATAHVSNDFTKLTGKTPRSLVEYARDHAHLLRAAA